jgi:nicotinate dehydrogenase subunit A
MSEQFEFHVNGRPVTVAADPTTPLLIALRNDLGERSTRHGCAEGLCGACTVLMDGQPVTACTLSVEAAAGHKIETVSAIASDDIGLALQDAILKEQAGQCGYCLAGILMQAKALLSRTPNPKRAEIAAALDGNLCRCGAHHRILNAIERAGKTLAGEVVS